MENYQNIHQDTEIIMIDEYTSPTLRATQIN